MKKPYRLLLALLLGAAGPVAAQAPPAVPTLHAVQTIALGPNATLGGTIRLPNHNTVLLLTDTERPTLQAQCLSPEGRTLWEATVARFQHPRMEGVFGNTISSTDKMADDQVRYATTTTPVSVFTQGNNVVVVERISPSAVKKLPKDTPFEAGQVYVQHLSEQGRLTRSSFAPLPTPKGDAPSPRIVGRYVDAKGFVEIMREDSYPKKNVRTQAFYLLHYDFGATEIRREPLTLPASPWLTGSWDMFRLWYQDWAYLGHRPNQTYFCRRLLVSSEKEKAGDQPLIYQVCIVDDLGNAAPGGFSTTLGLQKGTTPTYSGAIPNYGELDYAVQRFVSTSNVTGSVSYDSWATTAVGSFYLDHATGDVLVYGEYGEGDLPSAELRPALLGFFEQRYTFDGKPLARLQVPYTKDLMAHKKAGSFTGQYGRRIGFHLDPLTGQSQYSFSPMHVLGTGEDFDLFLDPQLHLQRVEFVPGAQKSDNVYTTVYYAMPFNLFKASGTSTETRRYAHAHPTDLPVYAALEQRSRAAGPQPFHEFHLSVTGPGTGLVIERNLGTGGTLQVFTF
jgi:hypothetical protein